MLNFVLKLRDKEIKVGHSNTGDDLEASIPSCAFLSLQTSEDHQLGLFNVKLQLHLISASLSVCCV